MGQLRTIKANSWHPFGAGPPAGRCRTRGLIVMADERIALLREASSSGRSPVYPRAPATRPLNEAPGWIRP